MPRLARLDATGILRHVIIRGLERRRILRDEKDQDDFLGRVGDLIPETGTSCYAWARSLGMSQPGVVYAVRRVERIAAERGLTLAG